MTATEELRRMLDERGVEYTDRDMFGKHVLHWGAPMVNGAMFTDAGEWTELVVENATPEQAIEATLGRGTCEVEKSWHGESEMVEYHCIACDEYMAVEVVKPDGEQPPNYCPNCGRRVVAGDA